MANNSQVTGNIGLYYVCYHLSKLGWNAMPTSRNARGVDIIAYNEDCSQMISIQVKTLSKRNPVPLGGENALDKLMGNFWIIVNEVEKSPQTYIMKPREVKDLAHRGEKDGKVSFWLQPVAYCNVKYHEAWHRIPIPK